MTSLFERIGSIGRPPRHDSTIRLFRAGLLSQGFLWEVADSDEVFAARLRREKIPDIRDEMEGAR